MKFTIIAPAYLPAVEYFISMINCKTVLFADHLQYVKRSAISRSFPLNKGNCLTVPVKHIGGISSIKNRQIAYDNSWSSEHIKTMHHQYNTYPFFEEYFSDLSAIYLSQIAGLSDLLSEIILFFLTKLKINARLQPTSTENFSNSLETGISSFAEKNESEGFIYKKEHADKKWLNIDLIEDAHVKCIALQKIKADPALSLSIFDFLFLYGPEASYLLRELQRSCFVLN